MKKRIFIIVSFAIVVLVGLAIWNNTKNNQPEGQNFTHITINGTILAYRNPEEGLYFIIDDDATTSYKEVIIVESTLFTDDLLKERILNREEGLYVTVEVDVWTNDLYTAALISTGPVD